MHNLHYYQVLMRELRDAIAAGKLTETVAKFHRDRASASRNP
jgi:queuine tRNA-ribosyltransferase